MSSKIRKGDNVIVTKGKDKGKKGEVIKVMDNDKILVTDINLVKKHVKPNPNKEETGGIIEREMPLDASNIMIYNPITKKADKVGFKLLENGKKVRVYKSNKEVIDI